MTLVLSCRGSADAWHEQLERTVKDLGRLVPFSVFIIVPAGELFLPIALKFFPNLLPSTYEDQKQKDAKSNKLRITRKDVSQFIRTTMKEGGILPIGPKTRQRDEFTQFFKKVIKPPDLFWRRALTLRL